MAVDSDRDPFGLGLPIGHGFVLKAELRVATRPPRLPVTAAGYARWSDEYQRMTAQIEQDVLAVLAEDVQHADGDVSVSFENGELLIHKATIKATPTPLGEGAAARIKAKPPSTELIRGKGKAPADPNKQPGDVKAPGSRGGKWWRDEQGHVRYGDKPSGRHQHPAEPEHVIEHFRKFHAPDAFASMQFEDLKDAIQRSEHFDPRDVMLMDWWEANMDTFLRGFGTNRKAVAAAGGLAAWDFRIGGRPVSMGEAVEAFFRANAELFVGDPDFGEPINEDDIARSVRSTMDRYHTALTTDPAVQALALEAAQKVERKKNEFFIKAERTHDVFDPLAGELLNSNDSTDAGMRVLVAAADLGLVTLGAKGDVVNKKFRGAIVPQTSLVAPGTARTKAGKLFQDPDQLERLNASQLAALYVAERLQDGLDYEAVIETSPADFSDKNAQLALNAIYAKLGASNNAMQGQIRAQLDAAAAGAARIATDHNIGAQSAVDADDLFALKAHDVIGKPNVLDEVRAKAAERAARAERALAAQQDESFDLPASMAGGVWNGKTLKDPNDPSKGVWEPMRYQKQYVNWMMAKERGIIAADAGLGKTPTVIAFMESLRGGGQDIPAVCFLPPSLMEQWPKEIARFAPEMADKILNLSGMSLKERKVALQSDLAKAARYILISTGTLTGGTGEEGFVGPNSANDERSESEDDGTGGTDDELAEMLGSLEGAVFIDEVHQGGYKTKGSTRHEIAKKVIGDRKYAFGMTATPMPNDPIDVYHLTNLFAPGTIGSEDLWAGRLAGNEFDGEKWTISHPEAIADLNRRLKPHVFYKSIFDPQIVEDMGKGLPAKRGFAGLQEMWPTEGELTASTKTNSKNGYSQHDYLHGSERTGGKPIIDSIVGVKLQRIVRERQEKIDRKEIDPKTNKPYEPIGNKMLTMIGGAMKIDLQRQASLSPALIDPTFKHANGNVAHSAKLEAFTNDVLAHFANGGQGGKDAHPMVAFSSYPQKAFPLVRQALIEKGIDPSRIGIISGDVDPKERGYLQDKLNSGALKVLLVGTLSGGAGLNLQKAANKVAFLDEPWSPAQKRQAQGRVWRTGQNETVFEKSYRTTNTADGMVEEKLSGKQVMVDALFGTAPDQESFSEDSEASLRRLLGRANAKFTEDQIRSIMTSADAYDLESPEHHAALNLGKDWEKQVEGRVETAVPGGKKQKPPADAQKELKAAGASILTEPFDEAAWRRDWDAKRAHALAGQRHQMSTLMESVLRSQGKDDEADTYARRAAAIAQQYPHVDPQGKSKAPAAGAKGKGAPAAAPETPPPTTGALPVFLKKDHPFKADSAARVKGTKIPHAEAAHVFDLLKKFKKGSLRDFIDKKIKPSWEGDYSYGAARTYVQSMLDLFHQQGLIDPSEVPS